ncbi:MAG: SH3 domain-containing protein [Pseudomonadota bacterium]
MREVPDPKWIIVRTLTLVLFAFVIMATLAGVPVSAFGSERTVTAATDCVYDRRAAYRVTKQNGADDTIDVRSSPRADAALVYELPLSARAIRCVGPCQAGWCRIRWHGVVGWVPRHVLTRDGTVRLTTDPYP